MLNTASTQPIRVPEFGSEKTDVGRQRSPFSVLMVAPTSFFADYGCHVRILEEARVLQALGHRVTIVTYALGRNLSDIVIRRTPPLPWHADYEVGSSRHKFAFDTYLVPTVLRIAREV